MRRSDYVWAPGALALASDAKCHAERLGSFDEYGLEKSYLLVFATVSLRCDAPLRDGAEDVVNDGLGGAKIEAEGGQRLDEAAGFGPARLSEDAGCSLCTGVGLGVNVEDG